MIGLTVIAIAFAILMVFVNVTLGQENRKLRREKLEKDRRIWELERDNTELRILIAKARDSVDNQKQLLK